MKTVGITGHQQLAEPSQWPWVAEMMRQSLMTLEPPICGLTCLAAGADQLFATLVLSMGFELSIVIPHDEYESSFEAAYQRQTYDVFRRCATHVECLPNQADRGSAYLMAGRRIVDRSDVLIAVWDGKDAKGRGGTGDVVRYAIDTSRIVIHIDPDRLLVRRLEDA